MWKLVHNWVWRLTNQIKVDFFRQKLILDSDDLQLRNKRFILAVLEEVRSWPNREELEIVSNQLLRSCTAVGANYRAARRARSKLEFYSKLCIVVEEIDECNYWLDLSQTILPHSETLNQILDESDQLTRIYSSIRKSTKEK